MTQAEIQTFPSTLFMSSTAPLPCLLALWWSLITLFAPPPWCALPHGHQAGQNGHEMGQLPAQIPAVPFPCISPSQTGSAPLWSPPPRCMEGTRHSPLEVKLLGIAHKFAPAWPTSPLRMHSSSLLPKPRVAAPKTSKVHASECTRTDSKRGS